MNAMPDTLIDTDEAMVPATAMMEALWWVLQRAKKQSVYNVTWRLTCDKPVNVDALGVAWHAVANRHEALRGSLHQRDRTIMVSIADRVDVAPEWVLIDDPGSAPATAVLDAIAAENHERPFDMRVPPPARLTAVTVGDRHELLITFHHSLIDGWGMQVLVGELSTAYTTVLAGGTPTFDTEPASLREYMLAEQVARADGRWDAGLRHWRETLDGAVTTTVVADRHRYTGTGAPGEMVRFALSKEANAGIAALAKRFFATPFVVFLAALQAVLARGGGGEDVCTGVVTANRMSQQDLALVGYVANMMFARTRVADDDTFGAVVERTRDAMWGTLAHQAVPFPLVFGALTEQTQSMLRDAIPVILNYLGPIGNDLTLGDVTMRLQQSPNRAARTDISIGVLETDDGFLIESEYNTGRYERETPLRLFHDLDAVLAAGGADPTRPLATMEIRSRTGPAHLEHRVTPTAAGGAAMPESAAMDGVRRAWADVLGAEPTGPDEDFFAMGGRSLKVVQFASTIESATGVQLDVVRWLADPTPRRAAEQLAADTSDAGVADSTLVELREGSGPHVHLVPGAGGGAQDYRDLVAGLPAPWRVTLSQERTPLDSVPAMAQRFRADLDAAGLRPDLLVGWSMGGQVAFELAGAYGDAAPSLAVLDSTPSLGYGFDDEAAQLMWETFASTMAGALGVSLDGSPTRTSDGDPALPMWMLAARLSAASGQPVSAPMLMERWATFRRHAHAVRTHVAGRPVAAPSLLVAADLTDEQVEQWTDLFGAPPRLLRVAADHYGMLRPPVITEIAGAIAELQATVTSPR